jgi:hypothetical protein
MSDAPLSDSIWREWYRALRESNPEAYRSAIQFSEGVALSRRVDIKTAAEYERAMVMFACELLGVRPGQGVER